MFVSNQEMYEGLGVIPASGDGDTYECMIM